MKTALVTGGTYGIGRAIAESLSQSGYEVAVLARNIYKTSFQEFSCDVLDQQQLDDAWIKIQNWKNIDILINNVGGEGGILGSGDILTVKKSIWQESWQRNMGAAIFFTSKCLPFMLSQKWGRVIAIASLVGKEGGGRPWYTVAKSAEISLMKSLSRNSEYVRQGVTFNSVAPGPIEGSVWRDEKKRIHKISRTVMGQLGTPQDVASVVTFLCSDQAHYVNGACWTVDGGESLSF